MPVIGMFHRTVFETHSYRILNFGKYRRTTRNKIAKHDILNRKSLVEVTGSEPVEISMEILLHGNLLQFRWTEDIWQDLRKLREDCEDKVRDFLVIGQEILGLFMIESIDEEPSAWSKLSNPLLVRAKVNFIECDGEDNKRYPPRGEVINYDL